MQPEENKWLALVPPPAIDPKLEELSAVVRSTECLRFFVLSTEYWLSPSGRLRWWLRINLFLGIALVIPAAFLVPVIGFVLREVDGWLSLLLSIVLKLIMLTALAVLANKLFPSSSQGSTRRRNEKRHSRVGLM